MKQLRQNKISPVSIEKVSHRYISRGLLFLSFIELDQAVVLVIRLTSFVFLWFQYVCPLMPSHNTYRLTWVSLTLDLGYLFMAARVKHSHCSLPWMRGISSLLFLLTFNVEQLLEETNKQITKNNIMYFYVPIILHKISPNNLP